MLKFKAQKGNLGNLARRGQIATAHGVIETPAFVPVGTAASVKGLSPLELENTGTQVIFANTYHLHLRPGEMVVKNQGGLHKFMSFQRPIMTDSGGFQAFSLGFGIEHGVGKIASIFPGERRGSSASAGRSGAPESHGVVAKVDATAGRARAPESHLAAVKENDKYYAAALGKQGLPHAWFPTDARARLNASASRKKLCVVSEEGVEFKSHLDGRKVLLTPRIAMQIQNDLGGDIIMAFDECTSPLAGKAYTAKALLRTHRWARICLKTHRPGKNGQALYGILQGGAYQDLREQSAAFLTKLGFPGLAVGGSLGQSKAEMHQILDWVAPFLPFQKPRHLLGIGTPEDIIEGVKRGLDTFDCVAPTREARNGRIYVKAYKNLKPFLKSTQTTPAAAIYQRLQITNSQFINDKKPPDQNCACYTCANFSRSYINHLFRAGEMLGPRLATIHNLTFMNELMAGIRKALS